MEITRQQRVVIWQWLEAVQSLAGAAKQTLHTFLQLQGAPAFDLVYLDETMVHRLKDSSGWKRNRKETALHQLRDHAPMPPVVEHLQISPDPEAVAGKDHVNRGSASHQTTSQLSGKFTFQLPMAPDDVMQLYLKKVSMQRDKSGQAPIVLGMNEDG